MLLKILTTASKFIFIEFSLPLPFVFRSSLVGCQISPYHSSQKQNHTHTTHPSLVAHTALFSPLFQNQTILSLSC